MNFIDKQVENIKKKPLLYIAIAFAVLLFFVLLNSQYNSRINIDSNKDIDKNELSVFVQDGCIHCEHAENFLNNNKFDNIKVVFYNLKDNASLNYLFKQVSRLNIPKENLGTPILVFGDKYIIGFGEPEKTMLIEMINEKKN